MDGPVRWYDGKAVTQMPDAKVLSGTWDKGVMRPLTGAEITALWSSGAAVSAGNVSVDACGVSGNPQEALLSAAASVFSKTSVSTNADTMLMAMAISTLDTLDWKYRGRLTILEEAKLSRWKWVMEI